VLLGAQSGPPWAEGSQFPPILVYTLTALVLVLTVMTALLWQARRGDSAPPASRPVVTDTTQSPTADRSSVIEAESMSDEEIATAIIAVAGGHLSQQELIDRSGWSQAKVIRVTSRLVEHDRLEKIRIGRENILRLTVDDPTDPDASE
jgi:hypothetical protein